jgi:hypothetical protein
MGRHNHFRSDKQPLPKWISHTVSIYALLSLTERVSPLWDTNNLGRRTLLHLKALSCTHSRTTAKSDPKWPFPWLLHNYCDNKILNHSTWTWIRHEFISWLEIMLNFFLNTNKKTTVSSTVRTLRILTKNMSWQHKEFSFAVTLLCKWPGHHLYCEISVES